MKTTEVKFKFGSYNNYSLISASFTEWYNNFQPMYTQPPSVLRRNKTKNKNGSSKTMGLAMSKTRYQKHTEVYYRTCITTYNGDFLPTQLK